MSNEPQLPLQEVPPSRAGRSRAAPIVVVVILVVVPLVIFGPLLAAGFEHFVLGTNHVESFLSRIGIHDELGYIYEPVIDFFSRFFR